MISEWHLQVLNQKIENIANQVKMIKKYRDNNLFEQQNNKEFRDCLRYLRTLTLQLGDHALEWKETCHWIDGNNN